MALPPIMIYGDDVTHIVTEEGIANLLLCRSDAEREQAIRGVAGYTPVGLKRETARVENLRDRGVIRRPEDSASTARRPPAICSPRGHQGPRALVRGPLRPAPAIRRLVGPDHGEVRKGLPIEAA